MARVMMCGSRSYCILEPLPTASVQARVLIMTDKGDFASQVLLMVGVALQELQRSEAETDLVRIRNLIANAQSALIELHFAAENAIQRPEPQS
jgi:hypothetical protein